MMSAPYCDPRILWELAPDDFNVWRERNDLPLLLTFFLKRLPGFQIWMDQHLIDASLFSKLVPTGDWFQGSDKKIIAWTENDMRTHKYLAAYTPVSPDTAEALKNRIGPEKFVAEVEPYFNWARRTMGNDRYFPINGIGGVKTDEILFNSWTAPDTPHMARAMFLSEFQALKLGGFSVGHTVPIGRRNLDFCDLDHLIITGKYHSNYRVPVSFSSCRKLRFLQTETAFFHFSHCHIEDFFSEASTFYDLSFTSCGGFKAKFTDCRLHKVMFTSTLAFPFLSNCEIRDLVYKSDPTHDPAASAEAYRLLRTAYQQNGQLQEAAEHYYLERTYRRKALFSPYSASDNAKYFPQIVKGLRGPEFEHQMARGLYKPEQRQEQWRLYWKYKMRLWATPRSAWHALRFKMRWLGSWLDNAIWGYGERPLRIFGTAAAIISIYTALYYFWHDSINQGNATLGASLLECLYFSLVTFSTLGYGDIVPKDLPMKILCGSEAILGGFTMGLVVAGFANKSRY